MAAVMLHHGYTFRETAGGTLACRRITGGSGTTLHAHGIACDHNPSVNRYRLTAGGGLIQFGRQTDMPLAMVRDLEALRLTNGVRPLAWGGRWVNVKDPMHWELDALRSQLQPVNLASLPAGAWTRYLAFEGGAPSLEDRMLPITPTSSREDVRLLQLELNFAIGTGLVADGKYGPATAGEVKRWLLPATQADEDDGETNSQLDQGFEVNAAMWRALETERTIKLIRAHAPGGGGGVTPTQLADAVGSARSDADAALKAHAGRRAGPGTHDHVHDEGQTGPAK
jgi:hypothetical protein